MVDMKAILVIGGTGAQGLPVVHSLSQSGRYKVRVLTRDVHSERAQGLTRLPNVSLMQGNQDNQRDLHRAFEGMYGAWVNTNGFALGEKNELFYGIRAYEIARSEGVKHYVYAGMDYALKDAGWDETYHVGHKDAKGRVAQFVLAQGQEGMSSSVIITGPYMNMLLDGMFVPRQRTDGTFVWANPATSGKFPLTALEDVGSYSLWILDHRSESAGMSLRVATDLLSFADIAKVFTEVTGKRAVHESLPMEEYLPLAEPFPNAPANFALGPQTSRDEAIMSWRDNFSAWWRYWDSNLCESRDFALLDKKDSSPPHQIFEGLDDTGTIRWSAKRCPQSGRRSQTLKASRSE